MNANVSMSGRSRILIASRDPDAIRTMSSTFSSLAAYDTVVDELEAMLARKTIETDSFDIAFLDIGDGRVLDNPLLAALRGKIGKVPVILISNELAPDRMRQLLKLDGTDWLAKPLHSRVLIDTVNTITNRLKANANEVHAVLPAGGGAGATCVAIMLAYHLSRERKRAKPSAAVFDMDFSRAPVAAYLNSEGDYDLGDVVGKPDRIDLEFIDIIKRKHAAGFSIFSNESPAVMTNPQGAEIALRMLDVVAFQHDYTIVDLPSCDAAWTEQVLGAVNSVIVTTSNTIPALQRAKDLVTRVSQLRGDGQSVSVIINKVHSGLFRSGISKADIERVFGKTQVTVLPYEYQVMNEALNRGVLPVDVSSRSGFVTRLKAVAEHIRVQAQAGR